MTPEGKNTAYLKKVCKEKRIELFKQSFENVRGAPDWLLCCGGRHIMIELKAPKGKLSPLQARAMDILENRGGFEVYTCNTPRAIDEAIRHGLCI